MAAVNSPAYRIGDDGKLYFTFNQGAEYTVTPPIIAPLVYRITNCELDELTGKEYFRIQSAGAELPARFSVQQVNLILSQYPCKQTAAGEPLELPLLLEEVREFYDKKKKMLNKANIAENKKLKGTDYFKNISVLATLRDELNFYRSYTQGFCDKKEQLKKRIEEINVAQTKILADNGVDLKILTKQPDCRQCSDMGVVDGQICECARKLTTAIKSYCATKRLIKRG